MFEGGDVRRRYKSAYIFDIQGGFGGDTVGSQEFIDRGSQELAVDQELKGDGLFGCEQVVHESRELVSTELCEASQSNRSSLQHVAALARKCAFKVLLTGRDKNGATALLGQFDIRTPGGELNSNLRRRHFVVYAGVVCLCDCSISKKVHACEEILPGLGLPPWTLCATCA